jgi:2-keto-4-pentenoate hydratase/2-oxohepta-3-ene-1,7-dioic acid hydratase in catechol pathway
LKIARVRTPWGISQVANNGAGWFQIDDIFQDQVLFGAKVNESEMTFLSPIQPQVVMAMAHNGSKKEIDRAPQAFQKSSHTITAPNTPIHMDLSLGRLEIEGELTAVISKKARNLTADNALSHVLGFTIANDVTAPEQTKIDHLLTQTKNGDGYTPLGPWIETDLKDFDNLPIFTYVNEVLVKTGSTGDLARGVVEQLVYVTRYMTLYPGDILLGGCPMIMYPVKPGDLARIEIPGLGSLINPVVASTVTA